MNDGAATQRVRKQNLFIVEGETEEKAMLPLLWNTYPEMGIDENSVLVFQTNIYQLYDDLIAEYGDWWDMDVDLAYLVSTKKEIATLYKEDFTNIVLIFDYERQDPRFDTNKIHRMQNYFSEMTDVGQLYLNYPMIESLYDLEDLTDMSYRKSKVNVDALHDGGYYKNQAKRKPYYPSFYLPLKLEDILKDKTEIPASIVAALLEINGECGIIEKVGGVLQDYHICGDEQTTKHLLAAKMKECAYLNNFDNYYAYMRTMISSIIKLNVMKGTYVQNGQYVATDNVTKETYFALSHLEILKMQNDVSAGVVPYIWILNMSLLFVPDYNFELLG